MRQSHHGRLKQGHEVAVDSNLSVLEELHLPRHVLVFRPHIPTGFERFVKAF